MMKQKKRINEEIECLWLTIQMLASDPELSSSNLNIACLLCHNKNLTLDFWDFSSAVTPDVNVLGLAFKVP